MHVTWEELLERLFENLSISYALLSTPSIIMMFTDVTLYSCCDLITLSLWLWLVFKLTQILRSIKCKNTKIKTIRWWFWDVKGREQKQEPGYVTKAPRPLSPGAYHHPVPTVTLVWDALHRKLESKRNRRETEVTTSRWGENTSECLVFRSLMQFEFSVCVCVCVCVV